MKLSRKERRELAAKATAAPPPVPAAAADLTPKEREHERGPVCGRGEIRAAGRLPQGPGAAAAKPTPWCPTNAAVNYKLAEANLLSGNLRDATGYAEAAVRLDRKNPYYYLLLAQAQASQKQYEAATATYASLVKRGAQFGQLPAFNWPTSTWPRTSCPKP